MTHRVLVVEDDPTLRLVMDNLRSEGYEIDEASNGACAIVVLDLTLPDWTLDLLPILRLRWQVSQPPEKLSGLAPGRMTTLQNRLIWRNYWRIRAVLRRARPSVNRIRLGAVTIDFGNKHASRGKRGIPFYASRV